MTDSDAAPTSARPAKRAADAAADKAATKRPRCASSSSSSVGRVYVAKYVPGKPLPAAPHGGRNVLIHTDAKPLGGALSPYHLRDEHGRLLENVWQFAKVYSAVSAQRTPVSRWHPTKIAWSHPAEQHVDPATGQLRDEYWQWRRKGAANPHPVRYPNGLAGRRHCLYSLWPTSPDDNAPPAAIDPDGVHYRRLDYIAARKAIYCGEYARLAPSHDHFRRLAALLQQGTVIQLLEVDGPNVQWYAESPIAGAIEGRSLAMSEQVIRYLVNDTTHPFGHGYVIAALLLNGASWITE